MDGEHPAAEKASLLAGLPLPDPFPAHGLKITITALSSDGPLLTVNVEATKRGKRVDLPTPFLYHNPPLIHDGKEDPPAALREIVAETVRVVWAS